jgi:guanosine-3',5'-bis(diphosphate) 3'-pyrophosphohydrolase
MSEHDTTLILRAAAFAAERHRDQRRKGADASPYINHPLALANLLCQCGERDPTILMAALLHDTVEDTGTTLAEIEQVFGAMAAAIVGEVTDDKSLPKLERKRLQIEHAAHLSAAARLVKLADKICNLRDMDKSPPTDWSFERRRQYFDWAKQVVDRMRGTHAQLEELFDAAYAKRPSMGAADVTPGTDEGNIDRRGAWQLGCDLRALRAAARRFDPAIRAARYHRRSAWLRYAAGMLIIEIDRGAVEIAAVGTWPATVSIRCGDLYKLGKILPQKQCEASLGFSELKLRIVAPGFKWNCPATLETPPASFSSDIDSTRLRPRKKDATPK